MHTIGGLRKDGPTVSLLARICAVAIACCVTACSAGAGAGIAPQPIGMTGDHGDAVPQRTSKIQHIVLLIQENRSFDNLFATFPGADGATMGKMHNGKTTPLVEHDLSSLDISHDSRTFNTDYNGGKMNGFDLSLFIHSTKKAGKYPYQYVNPDQIQPYWTMAHEYALLDHMFQTQGSGSFTAHQDLIAGATAIDSKDSIIDTPSGSPWGCDAPKGTRTSLITTKNVVLRGKGPFPCWNYPTGTMRDVLDAKGISWRYYVPPLKANTPGGDWNAYDAIEAVRKGPEWSSNISSPETNIFSDVTNHQLAAVSWVIPDQVNSDHPADNHRPFTGPSWIAQIVNAIGESSYWNSTAIIVVWDDWGGFYDHEPPAFFDDAGGLGFRVPAIVISPYVHAGTISHTQFEFGSILRFVENTFGLASLGTTDARAKSIGVIFHFSQKPRTFKPIASEMTREYFLHQAPSYLPVDTE